MSYEGVWPDVCADCFAAPHRGRSEASANAAASLITASLSVHTRHTPCHLYILIPISWWLERNVSVPQHCSDDRFIFLDASQLARSSLFSWLRNKCMNCCSKRGLIRGRSAACRRWHRLLRCSCLAVELRYRQRRLVLRQMESRRMYTPANGTTDDEMACVQVCQN